jgi:hypothetical protein
MTSSAASGARVQVRGEDELARRPLGSGDGAPRMWPAGEGHVSASRGVQTRHEVGGGAVWSTDREARIAGAYPIGCPCPGVARPALL